MFQTDFSDSINIFLLNKTYTKFKVNKISILTYIATNYVIISFLIKWIFCYTNYLHDN